MRSKPKSPDFRFRKFLIRMQGEREQNWLYHALFDDWRFETNALTEFPLILPRVTVGHRNEFDAIIRLIDTDLYDVFGNRREPQPFRVEW
jgi:hypothetical protein